MKHPANHESPNPVVNRRHLDDRRVVPARIPFISAPFIFAEMV
jgi:hypothetical protein